VETEFAGLLKVSTREGNSVSAVIRQAWDTGTLRTIPKNRPVKATGAHISIIGHITPDELTRYLSATDALNGFGNRFLWVCSRRSKYLPITKAQPITQSLISRLRMTIDQARQRDIVICDSDCERLWENVYPELTEGKPGIVGALTDRAESQVRRLS